MREPRAAGAATWPLPCDRPPVRWQVRLLEPYLSEDQYGRYRVRQSCSPQPAMRRVMRERRQLVCQHYTEYEWVTLHRTDSAQEALTWWLGDPWLPDEDLR